jgi:hypothetical protein
MSGSAEITSESLFNVFIADVTVLAVELGPRLN